MKIIAHADEVDRMHDIISLAVKSGGVIVCSDTTTASLIMDLAQSHGFRIDHPVCPAALYYVDSDTKLLFYDAENILRSMLRVHYDINPEQIEAMGFELRPDFTCDNQCPTLSLLTAST